MSIAYPLPKGVRQVVPDYVTDGVAIVSFPVPFRFFDPTDVFVGLQPTGSGGPFTQAVLNVAYEISGAGLEGGGMVTFFAPPAAGLCRVMGLRTPSRLTSVVNDGAIIALALENELDVQEMTLQELRRDIALVAPTTLFALLPFLQSAAGNKFLAFDANGNPIASAGPSGGVTISGVMTAFVQASSLANARNLLGLGLVPLQAPARAAIAGGTDTAAVTDALIYWNYSHAGAKAQAIPAAGSCLPGQELIIKDRFGDCAINPIVVTPAGGTLDDGASFAMNIGKMALTLRADAINNNWMIV